MNGKHQDASIGLKLNKLFTGVRLCDVEVSVLPHSATGDDPLFPQYIKNWREHIPSLREGLSKMVSDEQIVRMEHELALCSDTDFYLELTAVACGRK